jgi:hypothetical protein
VYRSRPLRSTAANFLALACILASLVSIASLLMFGGYGGNEITDHWSGPTTEVSLVIMVLFSLFFSLVSCVVGLWEGAGGEAHRTAKYSDGRSAVGVDGEGGGGAAAAAGATGAEQFERHVAFIVSEMKTIIETTGGQPLDPDENFGTDGKAVAAHLQAPTLSQFLMQDFDALPEETQQSIITSERLAKIGQNYGNNNNSNNDDKKNTTFKRNSRRSPPNHLNAYSAL